jgi:hypothetical protein
MVSDTWPGGRHDVAVPRARHPRGAAPAKIFAITVFVALRVAFSTVNGALVAGPDREYRTLAPAEVRSAVTYGRPIA